MRGGEEESPAIVAVAQQLSPGVPIPSELTLRVPTGTALQDFAVVAASNLYVTDRARVSPPEGSTDMPWVANTGTGTTRVGVRANTGSLWARGWVDLRNYADMDGDVTATGTVHREPGVSISGTVRQRTAIPLTTLRWQTSAPTGAGAPVGVDLPGRTLAPGSYGAASIRSGAVLTLSPGTYVFDQLTMEPSAVVQLSSTDAPTIVYVRGDFVDRGTIRSAVDPNDNALPLLLVVLGTNAVPIERSFRGTIVAPSARVAVCPAIHYGAFFAREVELQPEAVVVHEPFPWSRVLPPDKLTMGLSPVRLDASLDSDGDPRRDGEVTLATAIDFVIPDQLTVRVGNAGTGEATLEFRSGSGAIVTCRYQGGADTAHPTTDFDRAQGQRYLFASCSGGQVPGQRASGDWFKLRVLGGDADDPAGQTGVALALGDGCSDFIPPPMAAEELVALRDNFSWRSIEELAEADPAGRVALWHALIYVESEEQVAALDRLRVYYSARPLSTTYTASLRGKCGRVETATDGRGVVLYSIIPAKLFNLVRAAGIEAEISGMEPPFRFIIPSSPDEPEYMNADGSLAYEGLAASGYLDWLAAHPGQQPGVFGDAWRGVKHWVSHAAEDAVEWVEDKFLPVASDAVEIGFSYVTEGFDAFVDWTANALDNSWEQVQLWLHDLVIGPSRDVPIELTLTVSNLDPIFALGALTPGPVNPLAREPMRRAWGAPAADGSRPLAVPTGVKVRIRQWGWGFLPVMDEAELSASGQVSLTAVGGNKSRRDSDFCLELGTSYGMITTGFVPMEVCDFRETGWGKFKQSDIVADLQVAQGDVFAMTQIRDSYDYAKDVIGYEPHKMTVLTGATVNQLTSSINAEDFAGHFDADSSRAMTLCLDFPSVGLGAVSNAAAGVGFPLGMGTKFGAALALASGPYLEKNLWWPDNEPEPYFSRGVMTHEYGHFLMCSLLFHEDGAPGLTALIGRIFEGQDDARDDELTLMTETWADTFAMQVVGGSNYIRRTNGMRRTPAGTTDPGRMGYCVDAPCMDQNTAGVDDYDREDPFSDELARYQGLAFDAFDRSDSQSWGTNNPWNGDVWHEASPGQLVFATQPFIASDDEPVSLPGDAWQIWARKWVARGRTPNFVNVLGGLSDTMEDEGFDWCERCEVFALHHADTPAAARAPDPSITTTTLENRVDRWEVCAADDALLDILGDPPEAHGAMTAECHACVPLRRLDTDPNSATVGRCVPCPAGEVPRGNTCEPCPEGTEPSLQNECTSCTDHQIWVGGECVDCWPGEIADRATNRCVRCPFDAVVDWAAEDECSPMRTVPFAPDAAPGDLCPEEFWVEVKNLGGQALRAKVTGEATELGCGVLPATVEVYDNLPDLWDRANGTGIWFECEIGDLCPEGSHCDWPQTEPINADDLLVRAAAHQWVEEPSLELRVPMPANCLE